MNFVGFYEHAIDAKNRLAIPSKFRAHMTPEREGNGFVIVPGQPPDTLWLYPERSFARLADQVESALIPDQDQLQFEQVFFTMAEAVELDSQGRILIPERLLTRTGLPRDVVVCGVRDHLEIRSRDGFEARLEEDWKRFTEYQLKAQGAYRLARRQTGQEPG